jgi:hypothetical protein
LKEEKEENKSEEDASRKGKGEMSLRNELGFLDVQ